MENMMFSVPATQVWAAISANPTAKLANSIAAMEQEIDYFYQFKGLNKAATDADAYPNTRLNIRYHQMFTGAFMYAGGKHIGIEWGRRPVPNKSHHHGRKREEDRRQLFRLGRCP